RGVMALPRVVKQRLAGRPVELDGCVLDLDTQLLLRVASIAGGPPRSSLPVEKSRELTLRQAAAVGGAPIAMRAVTDTEVKGAEGLLGARLYVPDAEPREVTGGLLVYFHGGGHVVGDLDSHDRVCRFLAHHSSVPVLSVDYRLAPEHP